MVYNMSCSFNFNLHVFIIWGAVQNTFLDWKCLEFLFILRKKRISNSFNVRMDEEWVSFYSSKKSPVKRFPKIRALVSPEMCNLILLEIFYFFSPSLCTLVSCRAFWIVISVLGMDFWCNLSLRVHYIQYVLWKAWNFF